MYLFPLRVINVKRDHLRLVTLKCCSSESDAIFFTPLSTLSLQEIKEINCATNFYQIALG